MKVKRTFLCCFVLLVAGLCCSPRLWALGVPLCGCADAQRNSATSLDCGSLYSDRSVTLYDPREGNESEKLAEKGEMYRLFGDGRDTDCEFKHLAKKVALAAPLLGQYNGLQLVMRPPSDFYTTYGKRYILHKAGQLPPISLPYGHIAVDLHMHTCYSHDSLSDPRLMLLTAARRGLTGVAITDHDTLAGGLRAQRLAREMVANGELPATFFIIPGEEVSSQSGHVIALFLTHTVPSGMATADTIRVIHSQGGIAIAAHPLYPGDGVGKLATTLPFDLVETENAAEEIVYTERPPASQQQRTQFYTEVTKPRTGGGDAHDPGGIGFCYTVLACAPTPEDVRRELLAGRTTAVTRLNNQQIAQTSHTGLPSLFFGVRDSCDALTGHLANWFYKFGGATESKISILPSPAFSVSRRF